MDGTSMCNYIVYILLSHQIYFVRKEKQLKQWTYSTTLSATGQQKNTINAVNKVEQNRKHNKSAKQDSTTSTINIRCLGLWLKNINE
ncbi:hypothetical protein ES332_D06G092800v1 [Gossypium tomentosum]|uniref:Uncharacterized protein n=1 Tax=Gossypium tomentosum TaxID=34277 RepID=A0A5D2KHB1_GOSTO|nr:hypothetical protein ES332_D06G092800v1 [Gossypium tomentosum]